MSLPHFDNCHLCTKADYVNSKYPARQLKNAGTEIKPAKTRQWRLNNSESGYTSHTTNRIPTQTRIPYCCTARVHDLSHAGLSCISSTHDQKFKARKLPLNRTRDHCTKINSTTQHCKLHILVPTTGPKSAKTDAKLTPNEYYDMGKFSVTLNFRVRAMKLRMLGERKMTSNFALFLPHTVSFRKHRSTYSFLLARVRYKSMYLKYGSSKLQSQQIDSTNGTRLQQPQWLSSLQMRYRIQILRTMTLPKCTHLFSNKQKSRQKCVHGWVLAVKNITAKKLPHFLNSYQFITPPMHSILVLCTVHTFTP
jgi:hypothetical protein